MGSRVNRHLGSVLPELFTAEPPATIALSVAGTLPLGERAEGGVEYAAGGRPVLPPEFNWRDYTVMLLHTAAEIEHSLMVQYLFAAYSLGGPDVPTNLREPVRRWQEIILGIAKEEMGHLVTVQNLLTALGAPLNLDREDYPWGSAFYPFPFALRRLTAGSLAGYICAESPADWAGEEADAIREAAAAQSPDGTPVNRVGALYERLDAILADRDRMPDALFQERTLPYQASWDEWGRGYTRGERGRDAGNVPAVASPQLLVRGVFSRDSARKALHDIGEQGEAFGVGPLDTTSLIPTPHDVSHFERFLAVYRELRTLTGGDTTRVVRPVADNPRSGLHLNENEAATLGMTGTQANVITHPVASLWGHLFNLRYRMLLVDLAHAFRLAGPLDDGTTLTARGALIHRAFAEMYNLRAVAGKLVGLPLTADDPTGPERTHAGPPFEMPYTLDLPAREYDRWLLQRDLVEASQLLVAQLRHSGAVPTDPYLVALEQTDELALDLIQGILSTNRE
ncbi:ferritin-like domain-containing protein [Embleya sp. NPDC001921]